MQTKHWLILAGLAAAIATQLSGVQHWNEILSPPFVAGVLGQIAVTLTALFTSKPERG